MWSCIFILVKRGGTVEEWRWVGVRGTVSLDWKIEAGVGHVDYLGTNMGRRRRKGKEGNKIQWQFLVTSVTIY